MDIQRVDTFQNLGVTPDETLNWNEQVNKLCKSLLIYFGIFNQIKHKVTTKSHAKYVVHLYTPEWNSKLRYTEVVQKLIWIELKRSKIIY